MANPIISSRVQHQQAFNTLYLQNAVLHGSIGAAVVLQDPPLHPRLATLKELPLPQKQLLVQLIRNNGDTHPLPFSQAFSLCQFIVTKIAIQPPPASQLFSRETEGISHYILYSREAKRIAIIATDILSQGTFRYVRAATQISLENFAEPLDPAVFTEPSAGCTSDMVKACCEEIAHLTGELSNKPHIVKLLWHVQGLPYAILERFDDDLSYVIKDRNRYTLVQRVQMAIGVLKGLVFLHDVLKEPHNDLKEKNTLFRIKRDGSQEAEAVLCDFNHFRTTCAKRGYYNAYWASAPEVLGILNSGLSLEAQQKVEIHALGHLLLPMFRDLGPLLEQENLARGIYDNYRKEQELLKDKTLDPAGRLDTIKKLRAASEELRIQAYSILRNYVTREQMALRVRQGSATNPWTAEDTIFYHILTMLHPNRNLRSAASDYLAVFEGLLKKQSEAQGKQTLVAAMGDMKLETK